MHFIVVPQILVLHHVLSHLGGVHPGDKVLQCSEIICLAYFMCDFSEPRMLFLV